MKTLHPELVRQDRRDIPEDASEIRLFVVLRDEMLRLPYFLDYYRNLGISRFFAIDNGSKDGSGKFLLDQPDCHVFFTEGSYAKSRAGVHWLNSLLDVYGTSQWILLADVDELFVFPGCENTDLQRFCSWQDQFGYEAVYAVLLDMYSSLPIREVGYRQGEDFRATCPYHDSNYLVVRRYGFPKAFPPFEHIGGPRLRLCFEDQNTAAIWPRLKVKLARRALSVTGLSRLKPPPVAATQAYKVPLVKWRSGNAFVNSHRLNEVKLSPVTGALLHFKYFQDFGRRIEDALAHGEHYAGSAEYRRYGELLAANPNLSLANAESARYSSTRGLVDCGLIRSDSGWASVT
ncbi:glycosyltransferase family 2 protein [Bradyrhizobium monzae]|uniref:glycosyltransferase family 2 protein n=1 Tax=Bradyrhizobium sp. Oc8 TaxID=2876780 RepID=UPI001F441C8F|nr:glycosyltransferase family 2 protein [Bradyrhizobium sp. Oc8]